MGKSYTRWLLSAAVVLGSGYFVRKAGAGAITNGDLVVAQLGDGTTALSSAGATVIFNEYATNGGAAKQAINVGALSGQNPFTNSGSATSEGALSLSPDTQYIAMGGYDATPGTAGVASSSSIAREIGILNTQTGTFNSSTTLGTSFSGNNIRGAFTADGTNDYADGANTGVVNTTTGSTSTATVASATSTNNRAITSYGGNLYLSTGSGTHGIYQINGFPTTTGNTATNLIATGSSSSPYAFSFASATVCYIADDSTAKTDNTGGGVQKWVNESGTWTKVYTFSPDGTGTGSGERGLTLSVYGDTVTIYATTAETSANKLMAMTDSLSALTIPGSPNYTVLETAATNTIFRGVVLVPEPASLSAMGFLGLVTLRRRRRTA